MFKRTLPTIDGELLISIPSMLSELSVGKLIELQSILSVEFNDIDIISILSGLDKEELYNLRSLEDISVFNLCVNNLLSQVKNNYDHEILPEEVTFNIPLEPKEIKSNWFGHKSPTHRKVTVKVLKNLTIEPVGAFMNAKDIIADEYKDHIKLHGEDSADGSFQPPIIAACRVLAHYFYTRVYGGRYNEAKAEAFTEIVKTLSVTEALPIAAFFFLNYKELSATKPSVWARALQYSKKKREYLRLKNLDI